MKTLVVKFVAALALGGGLFVLVQACTESQGKESAIPKTTDPIPVRIMELKKSSSNVMTVSSGRLTTDDETNLAFKVGGVISNIYVKEGDKVAKGQVLATLDLTEIGALVDQAKTGLDKAERDLQRAKNLYRDSVAT